MADRNDKQDVCYSGFLAWINAIYIALDAWLFFAVALWRHRAWEGIGSVVVDARVMSPSEWERMLWTYGVEAWILFPPTSGCTWTFYVRKKQERWARTLVEGVSTGKMPIPWDRNRPRSFIDEVFGWF